MTQESAHVLDPCCGGRMMWFNKTDPRAIFGDQRSETIVVTDRSHREDGTRVLVFKWNETQVKLSEVLALTPEKPLFGQNTGRGLKTHWLVFMKPANQEGDAA